VSGRRTVELLGPLNAVEQRFAPEVLWTRGDTGLLMRHPRVAIVGTRSPSTDGERRTRRLVKELVTVGAVVVSGLAEGVRDEAAFSARA
jgi:DNA processing protein